MFVRKTTFCSTIFVLILSIVTIHGGLLFNAEKDLIFRLYTREQPEVYQELKGDDISSIRSSSFNPNRPTRIFVHGFKSKEKVILRYRDAYLKLGDFNFIAVDWTKGAQTYNYILARARVQDIADRLALLMSLLAYKRDMNLQDVTIVGHSLGAHIAGRAAKLLKSLEYNIGTIACIIGLDPASIGFSYTLSNKRLAITDADYVQVIHTDANKFGIAYPIGHADFYPNMGHDQPGCPERNGITAWIEKCSHVRSHHLFLESLTVNFTAIRCDSLRQVQKGVCLFDDVTATMGGDITAKTSPKPYGIFYLETRSESPYMIPDYSSFNKTVIIDLRPNDNEIEETWL